MRGLFFFFVVSNITTALAFLPSHVPPILRRKRALYIINDESFQLNQCDIEKLYFESPLGENAPRAEFISAPMKNVRDIDNYYENAPKYSTEIREAPLAPPALPSLQEIGFMFNIFAISLIIIQLIRMLFMGSGTGGGGGGALFGAQKVGKTMIERPNVRKDMWAGSPEIFEECTDIISFFNDQEKYKRMNVEIPRGFLLEGPPGCGKTQLAKIIATECGVNFISASGSEFVELFVGNGALKVRELFRRARENRPCIIFIDEIDAVGKKRTTKLNNNDEQEQTLNQILYEMDGFENNDGIMIMAATNRKDVLDDALLRPGRFDRIIYVPRPDATSRESILKLYLANKPHARNISFSPIIDLTNGMSGAQLKNVVNEAAIFAVKRNATEISATGIERSIEKAVVGVVKQTDNRAPETSRRIAIHELGHAILAYHFSEYFQLHKISIQNNYNGAEGFTIYSDRQDGLYTKDLLIKKIMVLFGGFIAEKMFYGDEHVSTGASHDIMEANRIAKSMVEKFGFGTHLIIDGGGSDHTQRDTDMEIHNLLKLCYVRARKILYEKKDAGAFDRAIDILVSEQQIRAGDFAQILSAAAAQRDEDASEP